MGVIAVKPWLEGPARCKSGVEARTGDGRGMAVLTGDVGVDPEVAWAVALAT